MNSYFGKPYSQWTEEDKRNYESVCSTRAHEYQLRENKRMEIMNLVEKIKNDENYFDFLIYDTIYK